MDARAISTALGFPFSPVPGQDGWFAADPPVADPLELIGIARSLVPYQKALGGTVLAGARGDGPHRLYALVAVDALGVIEQFQVGTRSRDGTASHDFRRAMLAIDRHFEFAAYFADHRGYACTFRSRLTRLEVAEVLLPLIPDLEALSCASDEDDGEGLIGAIMQENGLSFCW